MAVDWLQGLDDEGPVSTLPCPSDAQVASLTSTSWAEVKRCAKHLDSAVTVEYASVLRSTGDDHSVTLSQAYGKKREFRAGLEALAEVLDDQVDEAGERYRGSGIVSRAAEELAVEATRRFGSEARALLERADALRKIPERLRQKAEKLASCSHQPLAVVHEEDGAVSPRLWRCRDKLCPVCSRIATMGVQERQQAAVEYFDQAPDPSHYYLVTLTQISKCGEHLVDAYGPSAAGGPS